MTQVAITSSDWYVRSAMYITFFIGEKKVLKPWFPIWSLKSALWIWKTRKALWNRNIIKNYSMFKQRNHMYHQSNVLRKMRLQLYCFQINFQNNQLAKLHILFIPCFLSKRCDSALTSGNCLKLCSGDQVTGR